MTSTQPFHRSSRSGFTLVELLVSVALALMLIGMVAQAFTQVSQVFERGTAQLEIYNNIREAMDWMGRDIMGAVSSDSNQKFILANNVSHPGPNTSSTGGGGEEEETSLFEPQSDNGWQIELGEAGASDLLGFVANTSVGGEVQPVGVAYRPVLAQDPEILQAGQGAPETLKSKRPIFALQRLTMPPSVLQEDDGFKNYYGPKGSGGEIWKTGKNLSDLHANATEQWISSHLISFNIEVLAANNKSTVGFFDLDGEDLSGGGAVVRELSDSSITEEAYVNDDSKVNDDDCYPLGDGDCSKGDADEDPPLPQGIRVTIRFVDGAKETHQRAVQRVFWIPMD